MAVFRQLRGLQAAQSQKPQRSYQLAGLPFGVEGTRITLELMRRFVRTYRVDPRIVELSREIIASIPGKNYPREAEALRAWVASNIRYTQDVYDVETLQSPIVTLDVRQGDCDDQATLLATLLNAAGHEARFVAIGTAPDEFSHVLVETKIGERGGPAGDGWFPAETTEPVTLGQNPWQPGEVVTRMNWKI
jgi:transglutaminase-like putative cysteine protease